MEDGAAVIPIIAAVVGFLGAVAGSVLAPIVTGTRQHRQWLRDARLESYTEFLYAYDTAIAATSRRMEFGKAMAAGGEPEVESMRSHYTAAWGEHKAARRTLDERCAAVELVGAEPAAKVARGMAISVTPFGVPAYRIGDVAFGREQVTRRTAEWRKAYDQRRCDRELFLEVTKADLGMGTRKG